MTTKLTLCVVMFLYTFAINAQPENNLKKVLLNNNNGKLSYFQEAIAASKSGDSYQFISLRAALGALNSAVLNGDTSLISLQKQLVDNVIESARISSEIPGNLTFKDQFKGWVSLSKDKAFETEVPLYESYISVYIAQFLHFLDNSGWVTTTGENGIWFRQTVQFLEENVWNKWYVRSMEKFKAPERYFLRSRVHMGSNWAGFALYMEKLTNNDIVKQQCKALYTTFDTLLKRNLNFSAKATDAFIWNSTYDIVTGTDAIKILPSVIQDVSHANHIITYVVAAYELGSTSWNLNYLQGFCNTLKYLVYNPASETFADNVDGSGDLSRPNWGNFVGDGWIKLSKYDPAVAKIFQQFNNSKLLKKYNQELQFKSNLFHFGKKR